MNTQKQRWQYRFYNFKRVYFLLLEAVEEAGALSQLEKEGTIQRFEVCMELAWKCIKDYLESQKVKLNEVTPRAVLKEAIAAKVISEGDSWMDALDARNKMSHTYDFEEFEKVIKDIQAKYIHCFGDLYEKLARVDMDAGNA